MLIQLTDSNCTNSKRHFLWDTEKMHAYDDSGVEVLPVPQVGISPAKHVSEARKFAARYLVDSEGADAVAAIDTLPTALSFTGLTPATHYACFRWTFSHLFTLAEKEIAKEPKDWAAEKRKKLPEDLADVLDRFCILEMTETDFLKAAGLKRITPLTPVV